MEIFFQIKTGSAPRSAFAFSDGRRPGLNRRGGWARFGMALFLGGYLAAGGSGFGRAADPAPAELQVEGYGWLGNRELERTLRLLRTGESPPAFFDANFIEDAALILMSTVKRDGFLAPKISARAALRDGSAAVFEWREGLGEPLPRPLRAVKVEFRIVKGPLYHFETLGFTGLKSLPEKRARSFFIEAGSILPLKSTRIYTPRRLRQGISNLVEALQRLGFESASVKAASLETNHETGETEVLLEVVEGPKSIVRAIRREVIRGGTEAPEITVTRTNTPYSPVWQQDYAQVLRQAQYEQGFPDAKATLSPVAREEREEEGEVLVTVLARVETGPRVRVGEVRFEGNEKTRTQALDRRVRLEAGDLLDRIRAERGRYRLARLGIFETVDLRYEDSGEGTRDVVYEVKEGREVDVSLLLGFGSYELLRAGLEAEQFNVFGRAHNSRLRLVQSFKSSHAEYVYTMPELLGEDMDVFLNAAGLRREEVSFIRKEFGGGAGARKYLRQFGSDAGLRYSYEVLNAEEGADEIDPRMGVSEASVGALIMEIRHDQRDDPLYPRAGYKVFAELEVASELLAGDVDYQRFEISGAYHQPVGEAAWINFGISHGVVFTIDGREKDLPFNRRFFPGGESSIRGFQQGEASPRNDRGDLVGAETFLGMNIEVEQGLTPSWSAVLFADGMGIAREIESYPFDETLFSAGLGLRWRTLIGPVRLEYGHNLNRRGGDPSGTLHFSLGFPF